MLLRNQAVRSYFVSFLTKLMLVHSLCGKTQETWKSDFFT